MPDLSDGYTVEVELPTGIDVQLPVTPDVSVSVLLATGPQGPRGLPGTGTTAGPTGRTAGTTLSGHRLVVPDQGTAVVHADHTDLTDLRKPVWLTTGAAVAGDPVALLSYGQLTEPSWAWTPGGAIYVGTNGLLTQTPPTTGYLRHVATALTATTVWYDPHPPFALT